MKSILSLKFLNSIALVAVALCLSAVLGKAQNAYQGKFTLPSEAHWGGAVLPAGDYTISMPSAYSPYLLYVRGEKKTIIVATVAVNDEAVSDHSHLTLINTAEGQEITTLEAGQLGLTLSYPVPKSKAGRTAGAERATAVNIPVLSLAAPASGR